MKNIYIAVMIERKNGKFATVIKCGEHENILYKLHLEGIIYANAFKSKKDAEFAAFCWNEDLKIDNEYLGGNKSCF